MRFGVIGPGGGCDSTDRRRQRYGSRRGGPSAGRQCRRGRGPGSRPPAGALDSPSRAVGSLDPDDSPGPASMPARRRRAGGCGRWRPEPRPRRGYHAPALAKCTRSFPPRQRRHLLPAQPRRATPRPTWQAYLLRGNACPPCSQKAAKLRSPLSSLYHPVRLLPGGLTTSIKTLCLQVSLESDSGADTRDREIGRRQSRRHAISTSKPPPKLLSGLALVPLWLIFGSVFLGIKEAIATIPPLLMTGVRLAHAGQHL